jgi:hypothetical protein
MRDYEMRTSVNSVKAKGIKADALAWRESGHSVFVANYSDKLTSGFHEDASAWIEEVESVGWTIDHMTRHAYVTTVVFRLTRPS